MAEHHFGALLKEQAAFVVPVLVMCGVACVEALADGVFKPAPELGVHPQTVRYRMARLRELFGAALDDPDGRFELELALRVEPYARLAAGGPDGGRLEAERDTQVSLSNS